MQDYLVKQRVPWLLILVLACILGVVIGSLTVIPLMLYPHMTDGALNAIASGDKRVELQQAQSQLQNGARSALLQAVAGLLLAGGAIATWRQVQVNREGQITERFTRAIDQLGSKSVDIRLGGLYALERIAKNSSDDRATVASILTAFIRTHAPLIPPGEESSHRHVLSASVGVAWLQIRATDVQAAIKILGRRLPVEGEDQLYLSYTDLRKARFDDGRWSGLECRHANLSGARMKRVHLEEADLTETDLRGARLDFASLAGARLRGADVRGADFTGAKLRDVDVAEVRSDETTKWPAGFVLPRLEKPSNS